MLTTRPHSESGHLERFSKQLEMASLIRMTTLD